MVEMLTQSDNRISTKERREKYIFQQIKMFKKKNVAVRWTKNQDVRAVEITFDQLQW